MSRAYPCPNLQVQKWFAKLLPIKYTHFRRLWTRKTGIHPWVTWTTSKTSRLGCDLKLCSTIQTFCCVDPASVIRNLLSASPFMLEPILASWEIQCRVELRSRNLSGWWATNYYSLALSSASYVYLHLLMCCGGTKTGTVWRTNILASTRLELRNLNGLRWGNS